ncbi:hypothetical protein BCV72DRAFT_318012 [Rhizopus microsporus var. microsporus]|uniref:Uncharacterized protein n=1 Tax=Rhizopus microsporus var. microsporus TaxID=86635 RepID=A0A1X0RIH8_RHIZD|nr:hypothetical protein BCV72DRAFT_318012 [Rhizopus microsporus var. microsporus]
MASVTSDRTINPAFSDGSSPSDLGRNSDSMLVDSALPLSSARREEYLISTNLAQTGGETVGYLEAFSYARGAGDDTATDGALTEMKCTKRQIAAIQEYSSVFKSIDLRSDTKTSGRSGMTLSHRDLQSSNWPLA